MLGSRNYVDTNFIVAIPSYAGQIEVVLEAKEEQLSPEELFEILSHDIRRRIIRALYESIELSYTDLLKILGVGDGLLNFHLRKVKKLVLQSKSRTYLLSKNGRLANDVMHIIHETLWRQGLTAYAASPNLSKDIVLRRAAALIVDALVFFIFTGIFLTADLWKTTEGILIHASNVVDLHPWIFHAEHLPLISRLINSFVAVYSHILFAVYILLTLLEAFRGQTLGKYLLDIRVVRVDGGKIDLIQSGIRNAGKIFLLPLDLLLGVIFFRKKGYLRFFDAYTSVTVERATLTRG